VDVFDGYSFKGRHSVLLDDDDEDMSEDVTDNEEEPETEVLETSDVGAASADAAAEVTGKEPATPETTAEAEIAPEETRAEESVATPTKGRPSADAARVPSGASPVESKKAEKSKLKSARFTRSRREKSGIAALDRYISDAGGDETEATERDEEDDDWDFVEAGEGEERNGAKGATLFARGVVDRYRLALRKGSTPARSTPRVMSGKSSKSELIETGGSPSPSEKQRRGRTPGLTFRKHPKQFLRPKSPPSVQSSRSLTSPSLSQSASATMSSSTSNGFVTPASSDGTTIPMSPSLKSKESAVSVGDTSVSSDQSGNGDGDSDDVGPSGTVKAQSPLSEEPEKQKNKKLKKYKEGAEKVLSLFSPPR